MTKVSTSANQNEQLKFGKYNDTNSAFTRLRIDTQEWKAQHPHESFPQPTAFKGIYPTFDKYENTTFRTTYYKIKKEKNESNFQKLEDVSSLSNLVHN